MSWKSKYRFLISHSAIGVDVEVYPVLADLVFNWKKETANRSRYFRKLCASEFQFVNDYKAGNLDFDTVYAIEQDAADRCEKIELRVMLTCEGVESEVWAGYFICNDGDWNVRDCTWTVTPRPNDPFDCILRTFEREYDLLESITTTYTAGGLLGYIETETCAGDPVTWDLFPPVPTNDSCLSDPSEGWTIFSNLIEDLVPIGGGDYSGTHTTSWVRERVDGYASIPPGSGWIDIGGGSYVRAVPTELLSFERTETPEGTITVEYIYQILNLEEFDNGIRLEDILNLFFAGCYPVKSNFLRINPDDPLPSSDPYDAAYAGFDEIMIWQKSDVLNADADQNATSAPTTPKDFLSDLCEVFNLYWTIEGGFMRIEHASYFEGANGLDLTGVEYARYIRGRNNYKYNEIELPRYERFEYMERPPATDFAEVISYENDCSATGENTTTEYGPEKMQADFGLMQSTPGGFSLEGFAIAAVYAIGSGYSINGEDGVMNGHLRYSSLIPNYWTYFRPQIEGEIDNSPVTFDTIEPNKRQEALAVPICCDAFRDYDAGEKVKSEIGWADVLEASYSAKTGLLTINLLHQ